MKIVMINDCAYVGETLVKYFPVDVETVHLRRSRDFWDKTGGIAWKIFMAKADVYHVHYLLQDCYFTLKFGKRPVIGHAHGSDLRYGLKHRIWGKIIRYNLKHCDKVLVSTPDILGIAKKFRKDAEYIPNPVDMSTFHPKPAGPHQERLKVLIAANCDWKVKGIDIAVRALSKLKDKVKVFIIRYGKDFEETMTLAGSLGLYLNVLPKITHKNMREYYWDADIVIDRFRLGSLGMISLEAIACGRPVVAFVSPKYTEYNDFPLKNVNTIGQVVEVIQKVSQELWKSEFDYVCKHHEPRKVTEKICELYSTLI